VAQRKQRVSRNGVCLRVVFSAIYSHLVAGPAALRTNYMFGPAGGMFSLNPALRAYFFPALVPTLIVMGQQCVKPLPPAMDLVARHLHAGG